LILQQPTFAPHYVCEITKDGPLDALTVRVELRTGANPGDALAAVGAAAALEHAIKNYVGVSAAVRAEPPGALERSVGKAKRVIDKRAD
jgi:phenylacetate-CoA ligase